MKRHHGQEKLQQLAARDELIKFLLYTAPAAGVKVEVIFNNETLMAELFGVQRPAITKHLKNIYESGELDEKSTSSILEHMGLVLTESRENMTADFRRGVCRNCTCHSA